jgi:hypothetical protein
MRLGLERNSKSADQSLERLCYLLSRSIGQMTTDVHIYSCVLLLLNVADFTDAKVIVFAKMYAKKKHENMFEKTPLLESVWL